MADEVAQCKHHPAKLALLHSIPPCLAVFMCTSITNRGGDSGTPLSSIHACTHKCTYTPIWC